MSKSKYIDITASMNIIGCIYNNQSLLDDDGKYFFSEDDFIDSFHQIVFGSIYNLHQHGMKHIDLIAIEDYLSQRPKKYAEYKSNKGDEYILKCSELANPATFDYYYNRLKKMTLLRGYESIGMDLTWLYNPDEIFDLKKKQEQEDNLDNTSLEKIADLIDDKIMSIRSQCVDGVTGQEEKIGNQVFELIERLKENPDLGYPLYGPYINTVTRGARLGKLYLRSAATNVGKAIPNDTLIPTPAGWRKVRDIKIGDYLFGQNGKPTKVLKTYPQSSKRDIWEVEFSDGRIAKCCKEHLWEYRYESHRGKAYRVENTEQIYNRTLSLKNGFKDSSDRGYRFHVKLNEAVEYPEREYSIDPYVMGLLLGDGSFRYNETNKALNFSSNDDELPNNIANILGEGWIAHKNSDKNYNYTFKNIKNLKHNLWVEELLKDYPDLWQAKSEDKFIPKEYLIGSIEQRTALLQGLLDTDGNIDKKSASVSYTTISPYLKDDVIELARSLGFVTSVLMDSRTEKYINGTCYRVIIQCKNEVKPNLFRLKRKIAIAEKHANKSQRYYKDHLAIVDIRRTNEQTDMTCFTVDNEDHLFLMNDYIVTHNTRTMIADACYIGCSQMYDLNKSKWVPIGKPQPTLLITTEQDIDEVQSMCLAFLSGVNENHIQLNEYFVGEEERVRKAAQLLINSAIYFVSLPDFTLMDIENIIKRNIREHGVRYIFLDYIHTSLGILSEISQRSGGVKLREDNVLFMLAVKLKDICVKYGVFILSSTQLNADWKTSELPDQNLLRGAKSIADKIDWGSIMLEVTKEDLEKIDPILKKNGLPVPTIKMSLYKNRANEHKGEYMWMVADKGICRYETLFLTNWMYKLLDSVPDISISVEQEGAF